MNMDLFSLPSSAKKGNMEPKTFSFELDLTKTTDESYPEFSWTQLVEDQIQDQQPNGITSGNGPPINQLFGSYEEEDAKLKAIAASFDAKYGHSEDFMDKGEGYDESDPFIDNSECYDEVVPSDWQPKYGGFYINTGQLEFKKLTISKDISNALQQPKKLENAVQCTVALPSSIKINLTIPTLKL